MSERSKDATPAPPPDSANALAASEARFRSLIERTADGVIVVCHAGSILYVNPAAEELFGRRSGDLLGQLFGIPVIPGETTEIDVQRAGEPPRTPEMRVAEMRVVETTWEDRPAYLASLRDVTERKRAENALRFLAEASGVLGGSLDYNRTLRSTARLATAHLCDWCFIDVIEDGQHLRRVAVDSGEPDHERLLNQLQGVRPLAPGAPAGLMHVLTTGKPEVHPELSPEVLESLLLMPGQLLVFQTLGCRSCMIVPLTANGRTLGALTFVTGKSSRQYGRADLTLAEDLTNRAALALDNARMYDESQGAVRRRDQFLAMMAHELRNPLAPLSNALQILQLTELDPAAGREVVELAMRQVRNLTRLVDDLLDVSRVTGGKIRLREEVVSVTEAAVRVVAALRPQASRHGHALTTSVLDPSARVKGDPTRLEQILGNLLNNAIKYTRPGGEITLAVSRQGDQVVVSVKDTGVGISPELLPRIFDLFVQADVSLERSQGGLGIGLTLVKRLVEMHGGSITAHSGGLDQGSEFVVRLPAAPDGGGNQEQNPGGEGRKTADEGKRKRILVAEDSTDACELLASYLSGLGHEVHVAHDGPAAIEAARGHAPDVVLLDIGLPGLSGYEVAERLRREPGLQQTVIVAVTGYGQEEDRRRGREAGFHHHLLKPVDLNVLRQLITGQKRPS